MNLKLCSLSSLFDLIKGATRTHFSVPLFPKLALLLSVAGMLTGLGISHLVTPSYISEATMTLIQHQAPHQPRSSRKS
jgi:hypothetical protein